MVFGSYVVAHLVSGLALLGFYLGGLWSFSFVLFTFGLVPLAELWLKPRPENLSPEQIERRGEEGKYRWLLLSIVPLQYGLLCAYLWRASRGEWTSWEWVGNTLSMGVACGSYGINVAHELGHRSDTLSKYAAKALLLTSLYMHFFIEHNRGHHAKVATHEDPASARLGESLYPFWWRSVKGSFLSAWRLEARRLQRKSMSTWSWSNEMVRFIVIQSLAVSMIGLCFGGVALLGFVLSAVLGFSLLEAVNYIEHYGLQREKNALGRYEAVTPAHSWNADYPIGRVLLFELSRHSDHHAHPRRSFAQLRHFEESYQLPTGYPGMILLALIPPLFKKVMYQTIQSEARRVSRLSNAEKGAQYA